MNPTKLSMTVVHDLYCTMTPTFWKKPASHTTISVQVFYDEWDQVAVGWECGDDGVHFTYFNLALQDGRRFTVQLRSKDGTEIAVRMYFRGDSKTHYFTVRNVKYWQTTVRPKIHELLRPTK